METNSGLRIAQWVVAIVVVINLALGWWWSREPSAFAVVDVAVQSAAENDTQTVTGYATTATLIEVARHMLEKPGGYLTDDVIPPSIFLDNIPNWEFGVLTQVRDLARALRNDISRSQSQSVEDTDLAAGEPQFNFDSDSWFFPPTEGEYKEGIRSFESYLRRLANPDEQSAQFYARADNLRDWLALVEKRLGSLAQRLSASVGQARINTDLAGDASAQQSTAAPAEMMVKTPWLEIDDVFYEARGASWALIHFLKAVEIDFKQVLEKKNALVSLRQIIRELESTQETVWSPMILNGSGFSLMANHSLVMASYVSSANAAVIDLRSLLEQG
ncbi:MAG: DUF2333 family protein [Pseudomonadota bacterium]